MKRSWVINHLQSFQRPEGYHEQAWEVILKRAFHIWQDHLNNKTWQQKVNITCMEFYLMLLDEGKKPIVPESLINWVDNSFIREYILKYLTSGRNQLSKKNYAKALKFFNAVIKMNDQSFYGWFYLAFTMQRMGQYREALAAYDTAISLEPDNESSYLNRSRLYSRLDMDQKAMDDLNRAIRINPKSAMAYFLRAKFRKVLGDEKGALLDYTTACKWEPTLKGKLGFGHGMENGDLQAA